MIKDKFTGLKISKQRRYQLRKMAAGLCRQCGSPKEGGLFFCNYCGKKGAHIAA